VCGIESGVELMLWVVREVTAPGTSIPVPVAELPSIYVFERLSFVPESRTPTAEAALTPLMLFPRACERSPATRMPAPSDSLLHLTPIAPESAPVRLTHVPPFTMSSAKDLATWEVAASV